MLLEDQLDVADDGGVVLAQVARRDERLGRDAVQTSSRRPCGPGTGRPALLGGGSCGSLPDAESLREALAACASASEWDARRAMQWWQGLES